MTKLDWILLGFIALMALSGYRRGLIGTVLSLAGLAIGSVVGAREAPRFLSGSVEHHYSALVGLAGAFVGAAIFQWIGSTIASFTRSGLHLLPPLRWLDSLGGFAAGALSGALIVWILGAVAIQVPGQPRIHRYVVQSHVLRRLDQIAPPQDILRIQAQLTK